jgi:molecular chaperone GrpE
VLRQFAQALSRCEVVAVDAKGKPFDPTLHEAISQIETSDHPPGSVCEVVQKGYLIGDRLLRPALVVVAKGAPDAAEESPSAPLAETEGADEEPTEVMSSPEQPEGSD